MKPLKSGTKELRRLPAAEFSGGGVKTPPGEVKLGRDRSARPDFQREQIDARCIKANYEQKYILKGDRGKSETPPATICGTAPKLWQHSISFIQSYNWTKLKKKKKKDFALCFLKRELIHMTHIPAEQ